MTSSMSSKLVLILSTILAILGLIGLVFNEPRVMLPSNFAQAFRIIVMTQAGFFIGAIVSCVWSVTRLRIDPSDRLLRLVGAFSLVTCLLAISALVELGRLFTNDQITWRTPFAFGSFILGDWVIYVLMIRIKKITRRVQRENAIIKLTITDTHHIGPDIDLTSGSTVIRNENE